MQERGLEWRSIKGYEDIYEVSNTGLIKSLPREVPHWRLGTVIRKQTLLKTDTFHPSGYNFVTLIKNGVRKSYAVHRLVAIAFVPNPLNNPQTNHKDCNKNNNHVDNLEWVTNYENQQHAIKNGKVRYLRGSEHGCSKTNETTVMKIKQMFATGSYTRKQLRDKFGLTKAIVNPIIRGKTWRHVK